MLIREKRLIEGGVYLIFLDFRGGGGRLLEGGVNKRKPYKHTHQQTSYRNDTLNYLF